MVSLYRREVNTNYGGLTAYLMKKYLKLGVTDLRILTVDEKTHEQKYMKILDIETKPIMAMAITFTPIVLFFTPDHELLTTEGLKAAGDIQLGDKVVLTNFSYTFVREVRENPFEKPVKGTNFVLEDGKKHLISYRNFLIASRGDAIV